MKRTIQIILLATTPFYALAQWSTSGTAIFYGAGNVGIGTASPGAKLSFSDLTSSTAADGITWYSPSPLDYGIFKTSGSWNAPNYQQLKLNWATGIILDPGSSYGKSFVEVGGGGLRVTSGNVGIGTTNPLYRLQVNSNQAGNLRLVSNGSTTPNPTIDIFDNVNGTEFVLSPSTGKVDMFTYSNHALALGTANTERMRIDNNGNVGIGTASPGAKLSFSDLTGSAAADGITWYSPSPLDYGIFKTSGSWNAPNYQQLKLNWATGIILDPGSSYGKSFVEVGGGGLRVTSGNVGIGTTNPGSFKLAVEGKIWAKEVQVALTNPGPDYVFEPTYNLKPLAEIETYIKENKHLPEVPSAKEMEANGVQLGEMNMLLLKKVEELTLYVIELKKEVAELKENQKSKK
ncbi:MAG: hypothetical protein LW721_16790 [Flammeovirgaceae bacterium]|jgi:hypothetical protein|nr:hypothetical protein [Flammeovirgaceae bacterium]